MPLAQKNKKKKKKNPLIEARKPGASFGVKSEDEKGLTMTWKSIEGERVSWRHTPSRSGKNLGQRVEKTRTAR